MEFLRVCAKVHFDDVVISIKASNTVVMVQSVRLLVDAMRREKMDFPLHLGVTEAGEGEDGRIKSAVGIGALLADGIGDTIRVSLSEPPEAEIPVAYKLASYVIGTRSGHNHIPGVPCMAFDWLHPARRATCAVGNIGGKHRPVVVSYQADPTLPAPPHRPTAKRDPTTPTTACNCLNIGDNTPMRPSWMRPPGTERKAPIRLSHRNI